MTKAEEFAFKLLALEKEYGMKVVADDPFCGRGLLDINEMVFDETTLDQAEDAERGQRNVCDYQ